MAPTVAWQIIELDPQDDPGGTDRRPAPLSTGDATFEKDRWQQNELVLAGWRVLRFTWTMIESYPERVVATVRTALLH